MFYLLRPLFIVALFYSASFLYGQKEVAVLGFWNVENLFDTVNDPYKLDEEFTPGGTYAWDDERYRHKLQRLSEVISQIGREHSPHGLSLLGMCEVENERVLEDLVNMPLLARHNFKYVLIEGPDARGIDPCLLYNPAYFTLHNASSHRVGLSDTSHSTRDVLLAEGEFGGEKMAVIVCHWPSRRGGELASRRNRVAAAIVVKRLCDNVLRKNAGTKIVIMGDLNDDPVSYSVRDILGAKPQTLNIRPAMLYNTMAPLYLKGVGTLAWNDSWNLFDQIILNGSWLKGKGWQFEEAYVFNRPFLVNEQGNFRGYPFRTFSGGIYTAGYSDHFPSFITITRSKQQ